MLEELELELELDELLLEEDLELEVEELDLLEEVLLLDLEELVTLDVMELSEEALLDELFPFEPVKLQAVAHIAMSIKAPNNKLFFFIKNPLQLLNNKITIFSMVNLVFYFDCSTLFLAFTTSVASINIVFVFILIHQFFSLSNGLFERDIARFFVDKATTNSGAIFAFMHLLSNCAHRII